MENTKDKHIKAGRRAVRAMRGAKIAKKLYRRGYKTEEIAKRLKVHSGSVKRYFGMAGGIEKMDEAMHYKNRYIMKLPQKDSIKAGVALKDAQFE